MTFVCLSTVADSTEVSEQVFKLEEVIYYVDPQSFGSVGFLEGKERVRIPINSTHSSLEALKRHIIQYAGLKVWGQGGHNLPLPVPRSPASRTFLSLGLVSRLLPFTVFLPLSCKSRCLTLYSNRECFGQLASLSKIKKKCVVNRTTPHSPARSLKRHSFDPSFHHVVKSVVFCELQSNGANCQEGLP